MIWHAGHRRIDLSVPKVMGILNVTPDSFSDGGLFVAPSAALDHVERMASEGAELIDVGGESTRPGSSPTTSEVQIARTVPIIERIHTRFPAIAISIDTRSSEVARAAVAAGADIVNDISALGDDPAMISLAAETGVGVVLMHMRGRPEQGFADSATGQPHVYYDVVEDVQIYLGGRVGWTVQQGVRADQIVVDPGIGFGKDADDNLILLGRLHYLMHMGLPLMVGASRKRFIGEVLKQPQPVDRLYGSLAAVAAAILAGASIVRVHDVAPSVQVVRMCHAIRSAGEITTGS